MKKLITKALERAGYVVFNTRSPYGYARDGLFTMNNSHFRRTAAFEAAYARGIAASQGVDPKMEWRVHVALWAAGTAVRAPGDFVECGVNAGFVSSAIMQFLEWGKSERRFYLVDTFEGPVLEQYSDEEASRGRVEAAKSAIAAGAYVTDVDRVRANFAEWPGAVIVPGAVPDVLPLVGAREVAFLHLDMNCALPEQKALEYFWQRMPPGGIVLMDDYSYYGNENQAEAIDSLAALLGFQVLSLPTGQGLIVK